MLFWTNLLSVISVSHYWLIYWSNSVPSDTVPEAPSSWIHFSFWAFFHNLIMIINWSVTDFKDEICDLIKTFCDYFPFDTCLWRSQILFSYNIIKKKSFFSLQFGLQGSYLHVSVHLIPWLYTNKNCSIARNEIKPIRRQINYFTNFQKPEVFLKNLFLFILFTESSFLPDLSLKKQHGKNVQTSVSFFLFMKLDCIFVVSSKIQVFILHFMFSP